MTSDRFFIKKKDIHPPQALLSGREHHHLSKVARIRVNDEVWLFDEEGASYLAIVEDIQPAATHLLILEKREAEYSRVQVTLALAFIKNKYMDLVVQKTTEAGLAIFVPLITQRTEVKTPGKDNIKRERWKKIALEAVKQCGRSLVPEIRSPQSVSELLNEADQTLKILLSEKGGRYLKDVIIPDKKANAPSPPDSVLLLAGPEGGFTDREEKDILERDFMAVSLGRYTYRSETAAILGVAMVNHFWNA